MAVKNQVKKISRISIRRKTKITKALTTNKKFTRVAAVNKKNRRNQKIKKRRAKKPTPSQLLSKLKQLKNSGKPAPLDLNLDFYRAADGVYNSYWVGKLINTLFQDGRKKTVAKHVYRAFALIKFSLGANPLILFLEILDKIKPSFRLRNYIVRRVIIKEYPIVVLRPRQLILAVHWLKEDIQSGSGRFASSLNNEVASKLLDFKLNPKKNNLVKKRNEFTKRTIKAQFNIRYNFK